MVHFSTAGVSLLLSILSFNIDTANAIGKSKLYSLFPNVGNLDDGYSVAYVDESSHKVVEDEVAAVAKRTSYSSKDTRLHSILRSHGAKKFCYDYCPGQYVPPKLSTITVTKTKTTVTRTFTQTNQATTKTTNVVTADASTETITTASTTTETITLTVELAPVTSITSITETATFITTSASTVTVTIPIPTRAVTRRSVKLPSYLSGYTRNPICDACKIVFPPPPPKKPCTTTTYVTKTITKTATATRSVTETAVTTTTPPPSTFITTTPTTATEVELVTSTPIVTETVTVPTTTTSLVPTVVTTTVCARQTQGITGIGVAPPGSLKRVNTATDAASCCSACYAAPGCNGWAYLGDDVFGNHYCFYAVNGPPGSGAPTDICPNGLGQVGLFPGGDQQYAGGPGQCYR